MVVTVDVACLDILSVLLSQVELVGLNLLREHAETLFVEFHLGDEVGRLVVCVPAEMIHISVAVDDAGTNLCPKLDLGLCLAPDDGTEVRLIDTDDAVGTSADICSNIIFCCSYILNAALIACTAVHENPLTFAQTPCK